MPIVKTKAFEAALRKGATVKQAIEVSRARQFAPIRGPSGRVLAGPVGSPAQKKQMAEAAKKIEKVKIELLPIKKKPVRRKLIIPPKKIRAVVKKEIITPLRKRIITPLSQRQKRLIRTEKEREEKKLKPFKKPGEKITIKEAKIISSKAEREILKSAKVKAEILGLTVGKTILQNIRAFKEAPSDIKKISATIKKDPSIVKKLAKDLPTILKEEGKASIELFKTSPTEAIGIVAGNVLFFAGTGKALRLIGKVAKVPAKKIKKVAKGKQGTKIKFIGTQSQKGKKITTKIIFQVNGKQIGGAVGKSTIKEGKILTQTVGKVGKLKIKKVKGRPKVKKFKVKAVFAGREISVAKRKKLRIRKRISGLGIVTRNIEGIAQVSLGRVATARGEKLLRTVVQFPTAKLKKKKVKSLKVKDFVSISAVLTKGDLSLIVGKTLKKKKDITEFVGLIKGISKKDVTTFSPQRQKLFRQALKDVAGTISASSTRSKKIIPKLSPKGKNVILKRVSGKVVKGKIVVGVKTIQRAKVRLKAKARIKEKAKAKLKQLQKQKTILTEKTKLTTKQKLKLLTVQKQITKAKTKAGIIIFPKPKLRAKVKLKAKPTKPKRIITKKPRKRKRAFNVWARPLKKRKERKKPKLIKINKVPLNKRQAKDLRNYVSDTSLSRTSRIKSTRGKPSSPKIKVPKSYSKKTKKKFRTYRIVKGKRKPLPKGTVIERKRNLLDTRQEKNKITLRKRIKQITPKRKPTRKRKVIRSKRRIKKRAPKRKMVRSTRKKKRKVTRRRSNPNRGIFG